MALLHEEEDDHIPQDKRKEQGTEGRQTSEPEMAEFVIVAKFGDRVLHRLASSLSNVIRQVGRQTKIPVLVTFLEFSIWHLVTI